PALATFLPLMKRGRGLPFHPTTLQTAKLVDSTLTEFGKIAQLQRFAGMERYGLSRSEMLDAKTIRIEVQPDIAELMDREASYWLIGETMRRVAQLQGP